MTPIKLPLIEKQKIVNYFVSLKEQKKVKIEVELKEEGKQKFEEEYEKLTGNSVNTEYCTLIPAGKNKWGRELRIYYESDGKEPPELIKRRTKPRADRSDSFTHRFNNNEVVTELFSKGFKLGIN